MNTEDYKVLQNKITYIKSYLDDRLDEDALAEFKAWMRESESNQQLLNRLQDKRNLHRHLLFLENNDLEGPWARIQERIHKPARKIVLFRYLKYVAAILLVIGCSLGIYYGVGQNARSPDNLVSDNLTAGVSKAYITLANGEQVVLGNGTSNKKIWADGVQFNADTDAVTIEEGSDIDKNSISWNRIFVPRGAEYKLILQDGTQVWMNSDTKIEFPAVFAKNERRIKLHGEAFFQVTKNVLKPFIIETNGKEVKVLGTTFNIHAYANEHITTLVEGKVRVSLANQSQVLHPSQQAVLKNGGFEISTVNTLDYTAWKDGLFVFNNMPLHEILTGMSRWYDMTVYYENSTVANLNFSGDIKRYASLNEVLSFLESTNTVHFKLEGRKLMVSD